MGVKSGLLNCYWMFAGRFPSIQNMEMHADFSLLIGNVLTFCRECSWIMPLRESRARYEIFNACDANGDGSLCAVQLAETRIAAYPSSPLKSNSFLAPRKGPHEAAGMVGLLEHATMICWCLFNGTSSDWPDFFAVSWFVLLGLCVTGSGRFYLGVWRYIRCFVFARIHEQ